MRANIYQNLAGGTFEALQVARVRLSSSFLNRVNTPQQAGRASPGADVLEQAAAGASILKGVLEQVWEALKDGTH